MAAVTAPSGFRFVPTDLELVRDYLLKKITNQPLPSDDGVIEYDVYNTEPCNLPGMYESMKHILYFGEEFGEEYNHFSDGNDAVNNIDDCARFCSRKIRKRSYYFVRREKNDDESLCDGNRVKHLVKCGDGTSKSIVGYWKRTRPTPHDKLIRDERNQIVGIRKAFVFHYYTSNNGNNDNGCSNTRTGWVMHEYTLNSQQFQPWVLCSVINNSQSDINLEFNLIEYHNEFWQVRA